MIFEDQIVRSISITICMPHMCMWSLAMMLLAACSSKETVHGRAGGIVGSPEDAGRRAPTTCISFVGNYPNGLFESHPSAWECCDFGLIKGRVVAVERYRRVGDIEGVSTEDKRRYTVAFGARVLAGDENGRRYSANCIYSACRGCSVLALNFANLAGILERSTAVSRAGLFGTHSLRRGPGGDGHSLFVCPRPLGYGQGLVAARLGGEYFLIGSSDAGRVLTGTVGLDALETVRNGAEVKYLYGRGSRVSLVDVAEELQLLGILSMDMIVCWLNGRLQSLEDLSGGTSPHEGRSPEGNAETSSHHAGSGAAGNKLAMPEPYWSLLKSDERTSAIPLQKKIKVAILFVISPAVLAAILGILGI